MRKSGTPVPQRTDRIPLHADQRTFNKLPRGLRSQGERGCARLVGQRMVIDCRSSMRRQGVSRAELPEVRHALEGCRPEGFSVHLPIDRPYGADPVYEIAEWVRALDEAGFEVPVMYVTHLSRVELEVLSALYLYTRFRLRTGTDLWLGDRDAIQSRATVLDVLKVGRGERVGYYQGRLRHGGWVVVVSGGAVQGIGLESSKALSGLLPRPGTWPDSGCGR